MSAPNTNVEKQAERHRGPLTGMLMAVIWAGVLLAALVIYIAMRGSDSEGTAAQVDGRTGGTEATAADAADDAAPLVQPEATTGADAGAGEEADTNPTETQVATPEGGEPAAAPAADD